MSSFYNRQFELYVGDSDVPFIAATSDRQFRVVFKILIDWGAYNSYADIAITGLARETEAKIFKRGQRLEFKAGYEDNIDFIFKGEIRNILREREDFGGGRVTRILCRSADTALQSSVISKSFQEGVKVPDIVRACAEALGFEAEIKEEDFENVEPYTSGYTVATDPKRVLNDLARAHDFNWLIDNNKLVVVGGGSFRDSPLDIISAFTGMVGSPEITEIGCDVVQKLNPQARIGARFKIQSEFALANFGNVYYQDIPQTIGEGTYVCRRLEFSGDSYGDDWQVKRTGFAEDVSPQ